MTRRSPDVRVYPGQWNTSWLQTELGKAPTRRKALPEAAEPMRSLKIWSLIKDWVGKDISRLSVPVYINEPLCELQKRAEGFQHSYLLDQVYLTWLCCSFMAKFGTLHHVKRDRAQHSFQQTPRRLAGT